MIDEIVAADTAAVQIKQVPVKTADDGDQIARILHGVCVRCGLLLDEIGSVGDGDSFRHGLFVGLW